MDLDFINNYIHLAEIIVEQQCDIFKSIYYKYLLKKMKGIKCLEDANKICKLKESVKKQERLLRSPYYTILFLGLDSDDIIKNLKAECKLEVMKKLNRQKRI